MRHVACLFLPPQSEKFVSSLSQIPPEASPTRFIIPLPQKIITCKMGEKTEKWRVPSGYQYQKSTFLFFSYVCYFPILSGFSILFLFIRNFNVIPIFSPTFPFFPVFFRIFYFFLFSLSTPNFFPALPFSYFLHAFLFYSIPPYFPICPIFFSRISTLFLFFFCFTIFLFFIRVSILFLPPFPICPIFFRNFYFIPIFFSPALPFSYFFHEFLFYSFLFPSYPFFQEFLLYSYFL